MHYHALSRYPESDVVLVNQAGQEKVIVAKPNTLRPGGIICGCSPRWRCHRWARDCFCAPGRLAILPLAGLELTALGGALYWVNWKLEYRHVIR